MHNHKRGRWNTQSRTTHKGRRKNAAPFFLLKFHLFFSHSTCCSLHLFSFSILSWRSFHLSRKFLVKPCGTRNDARHDPFRPPHTNTSLQRPFLRPEPTERKNAGSRGRGRTDTRGKRRASNQIQVWVRPFHMFQSGGTFSVFSVGRQDQESRRHALSNIFPKQLKRHDHFVFLQWKESSRNDQQCKL